MDGVKVIFFDMGNTLLHFHHGNSDEEKDEQGLIYLTKYLNKFNSNITINEVKNIFFKSWIEGIEDRTTTFKEYPIEDFLNDFLAVYNIKLHINECIEAINEFYTEYRENVFFEDNLYDILKTIKDNGYKIGIISNTCYYDEVMKECFRKAGIYELIDNFTFSYALRLGKPNVKIFKTAIDAMKVISGEAVMIGDKLKSDIKPALELGMKTIWLNNKNEKANDEIIPDLEVSSIGELLKYL